MESESEKVGPIWMRILNLGCVNESKDDKWMGWLSWLMELGGGGVRVQINMYLMIISVTNLGIINTRVEKTWG